MMEKQKLYLRLYARRDLRNLLIFGRHAPLFAQRIWIDPAACTRQLNGYGYGFSGRVVPGDWDLQAWDIGSEPHMVHSRRRWAEGRSWREAGAYEYMAGMLRNGAPVDGCDTHRDVVRRYEALDAVFDQSRRDGRLRTRQELDPDTLREFGGVYVHLDREARPIFGGKGAHRLAAAQVLGLPQIPAQLGMVHADALTIWKRLTRPASELETSPNAVDVPTAAA